MESTSSVLLTGLQPTAHLAAGADLPVRLYDSRFDFRKLCGGSVAGQATLLQACCTPSARRAFKILTVSEFSKREIMAWAGLPASRVEVVYNGVGDAFKSTGPRRQASPYVLYVGNQRAHKNVDSC